MQVSTNGHLPSLISSSPEDLSYSLFLERVSSSNSNSSNNNSSSSNSSNNLSLTYNRPAMNWVPDNMITHCYHCQTSFTFYRRKHHCRLCGRGVCATCSNYFTQIPAALLTDVANKPNKEKGWLPTKLTHSLSSSLNIFFKSNPQDLTTVRVCHPCYKKIQSFKRSQALLLALSYLPLAEVQHLARVSKEWAESVRLYKTFFREIQYRLPFQAISNLSRRLLEVNRDYLSGHNRWILQLLLIGVPINLSNLHKSTKCWSLMCTRICKAHLTIAEVIEYLTWTPTSPNQEVLDYLKDILLMSSEKDFKLYLPNLVWCLSREVFTSTNRSELLSVLIFRSLHSMTIRVKTYWDLAVLKNLISGMIPSYNEYMLKLHHELGPEVVMQDLIHGRRLLKVLALLTDAALEQKVESPLLPVPNPLDPTSKILNIDLTTAQRLESFTRPLIIPLTTDNSQDPIQKVLYKKGSLFQDRWIIQVLRTMSEVLIHDLGLDCEVQTYEILPLDVNSGYISIVPDSQTLYSLKYDKKLALTTYVYEQNGSEPVQKVRDRFIRSTAFACVASYLLGLGDRHLDNIMIHKSGRIFHIDYGYAFGDETQPLAPQIRLTRDMIEMIGGENSASYQTFKNLTVQIYNCLRKHANLFLTILWPLTQSFFKTGLNEQKLITCLTDRWIPAQLDYEAEATIQLIIDESSKTYASSVIDYYRYCRRTTISFTK